MADVCGSMLLEVLLSLLLLGFLMFGLSALHLHQLHAVRYLHYARLAEQQLENINDRLKLSYDMSNHLLAWNQENMTILPKGVGAVYKSGQVYLAVVCWGGLQPSQNTVDIIGLRGCMHAILS